MQHMVMNTEYIKAMAMASPDTRGVLEAALVPLGFELYPFLLGWYNERCGNPVFRLGQYDDTTLAYLLVSTPDMYERCFKPYVSRLTSCSRDPLDQCIQQQLQPLCRRLGCHFIADFELTPTRRPKILMQTAGHVSGAAYYYQRSDVQQPPWPPAKKIFGVNIHPKYGGWFAFRGIIICEGVTCPNLERREPADVVPREEDRVWLLEQFNDHWEEWAYRDVITPVKQYSEEQKQYFNTKPADRWALLGLLKESHSESASESS